MRKVIPEKTLNFIYLSLVSLFIFIFLCFPQLAGNSSPGLDSSWVFALNYIFAHGIQFGKDVIFTYGPLGFAFRPEAQSNNILIALIVISALKLGFIFSILKLTFLTHHSSTLPRKIFSFSIAMLLILMSDLDTLPFFLVVILVLCHFETKKASYAVIAAMVAGLSLLIKINIGLAPALVIAVYAVFVDISEKRLKMIPILFFSLIFGFLASWFSIYDNLLGIGKYLYGSAQFAIGQSESMSLPTNNNWFLILSSFLCFVSVPLFLKDKRAYLLYAIILIPYYSFFKYCFGRETHLSLSLFLTLQMYFFLLLILYIKKIKPIALSIMFSALVLFGLNTYRLGYMLFTPDPPTAPQSWFIGYIPSASNSFAAFKKLVFHRAEFEQQVKKASAMVLQVNKLSPDWLQEIGNKTIDIYPFELSYAAANNINWTPRPVLQSFTAFTPYLDQLDARFYSGVNAPEFLLWHLDWGLNSVDTAYLLNDGPETILSIFNRYKVIKKTPKLHLLQRQTGRRLGDVRVLDKIQTSWEAWNTIPVGSKSSVGIYRARLVYQRNLIGVIKKSLYNDNLYFIYYKFRDGRIVKHRLKLPNAAVGVWVSPYVVDPENPVSGEEPVAVLFSAMEPQYMKTELQIEWQFIPMNSEFLDE